METDSYICCIIKAKKVFYSAIISCDITKIMCDLKFKNSFWMQFYRISIDKSW